MLIVDAHLDLSYNALAGREILRPAREQTGGSEIPTVGLPDLRAGDVRLVCATVFTEPSINGGRGYHNADEAFDQGQKHLEWYRRQATAGVFRFVTDRTQIEQVRAAVPSATPSIPIAQHAILLMEGADPLRTPDDIAAWHDAGLRAIGLAWKRTRYAGGTGAPGPLTAEGVELVIALDEFGIIHDTSHLAEESFWELLELTDVPVMASHSNCRSIVPTDRQLSDEMIRAITTRGGVIGINFFDRFLLPPDQIGKRRATLADVVAHIRHICDLTGDANHVGLGTDMDGGLGRNEIPVEIQTSGDLPRVGNALLEAGFDEQDTAGILGENWLRFFEKSLVD
jgi:membrane dipeptidase